MPNLAVTHSGKFHADDVLAWTLISLFYDESIQLLRSRHKKDAAEAAITFDVGGEYDPEKRKFDHHQQSYQGNLSSAGMILQWLHKTQKIDADLFNLLKQQIVDYVDDVDNGRKIPHPNIPCYPSIIENFNNGCHSLADFDDAFQRAVQFSKNYIQGIHQSLVEQKAAARYIQQAMHEAERQQSNIIELPRYMTWKTTYFAMNGAEHITEFVIFPTLHQTWQAVAIPPKEDSFAQKRSFPKEWAGLRDEELAKVTGEIGSLFCHKNRFVAVFQTREELLRAMHKFQLLKS